MRTKRIWMYFAFFLFSIFSVDSHPGRTNADGCHVCRTNCEKWGLTEGQYHCHGSNKDKETQEANSNVKTEKIQEENLTKVKIQEEARVETPKCNPDFKCKDVNLRGYQFDDCSWISIEYCDYGCESGKCIIKNSLPSFEINATITLNATVTFEHNKTVNNISEKYIHKIFQNQTNLTNEYPANGTKININQTLQVKIISRKSPFQLRKWVYHFFWG